MTRCTCHPRLGGICVTCLARFAGFVRCSCGREATTYENGRDMCGQCAGERMKAVSRQASARRRAVVGGVA